MWGDFSSRMLPGEQTCGLESRHISVLCNAAGPAHAVDVGNSRARRHGMHGQQQQRTASTATCTSMANSSRARPAAIGHDQPRRRARARPAVAVGHAHLAAGARARRPPRHGAGSRRHPRRQCSRTLRRCWLAGPLGPARARVPPLKN